MFPFSISKVAKVVLSMEADLPMTVNTSRLIITDLTVLKLRENKNSNNIANNAVIKSTSKKEMMILGDFVLSM